MPIHFQNPSMYLVLISELWNEFFGSCNWTEFFFLKNQLCIDFLKIDPKLCSLVYDVNIFLFLDDDDEESTYEEEDHSQDHHTEVSNDKNPPKIN